MNPGASESALSRNTAITDMKNYTSGGHKSSAHGITFHEQCLLLCAYRSLASGKEFRMASEVDEAGKFDDLVYFHEVDGKVVCELVQYKHKENTKKPLSWSELVSDSKNKMPYSLVAYLKSYLQFSAPFENKFNCTINSCVLSTNRDFVKESKKPGHSEDFELENMLERMPDTQLFCNGISYRFKAECRAAIREILLKKINFEILEKLIVYVEILKTIAPNVEMFEKLAANVELLEKFDENVKTFNEIVPKFATLEKFAANVEMLEKFITNVEMLEEFVANVEMFKNTVASSEVLEKFDESVEKIATNYEMFLVNVKILEKHASSVERLKSVLNAVRSGGDDFLEKFVLCVEKKLEEGQLETEIKREIETCLKNQMKENYLNRVDDIYVYLYNRMNRFHSSKETPVATETEYLEWLLKANETLDGDKVAVHHEYNMYRLPVYGTNLFTDGSVKKLKDSLENCPENIFCVVGRECTVFALLKLVQVLKETDKRFHVIVDDQFLSLSDEQVTIGEYLIVRCESSGKWNDVVEKTRKVLGIDTEKKIALVVGFEDCSGLERICDETRWSDLTENTRQRLGHKSISFQGMKVPFSELNVSAVEEWIDERVLDGIFKESLNISTRFYDKKSEEMDYFVDRRIGRRNRIDMESFRDTGHMFVVENMTEPEFKSFIAEKCFDRKRFQLLGEEGFDVFRKVNENKNISLLYHVEGTFYWKKSHGESVEESSDKGFDAVIELDDVSRVTDRTVLIIAEPGMGKSNLLSALLERSVEKRSDVWIVKINLNSHTTLFYDMQNKHEHFCKKSAIEFVVESQSFESFETFESYMFRSYFNLSEKLIILLDGFDEIAPGYRDTVLDLIANLKSIPTIRLWLTSRPQERDYLETRLRLMSYSMLEFTDEDQKKFFTRFWLRSGEVVDARAHEFIDRLLCIAGESFRNTERLVTGIPLQCRMLGEVYRPEFDGFYRSESVDPESLKVLDILDLYKEFISKIFDRYFKEKLNLDLTQQGLQGMINKEKNDLNEIHKLLSLEIVFPHRFETTYAAELEKYKKCIVDGEERTGIVHSLDRDRRAVFLHRTFAEYFSALWFYDELKASDRETNRDLFDYIEKNMFEPQYEVFRKFFDRMSVRSEPVLEHVLNGDIDSLERDPDLEIVSSVDDFSRNALHLAASYGHNGMIRFLISRGVRVDARDRLFDLTPLKYGISGRVLIPSSTGFMNGLDYDSIVSLLPGNEDDQTMYERITNRNKLLLDAAKHGRGELVDYLRKHGMDVDVRDSDGCSPLHLAAKNGHDGVCATLIEYESPVDCRDERGWTPLHHACVERHASTVALLLDRGADMNAEDDDKETPLQYARILGNESIVALMIDRGAVVNTDDFANMMPLHFACDRGHDAIVALLLDDGADVNEVDDENMTPLHFACVRGHDATVALLLDGGADLNPVDDTNTTPLHWACAQGHDAIVALLLDGGADVEAKDGKNMTPLHFACNQGHDAIVSLLLDGGADFNAVDDANMTPLHWACVRSHDATVALLLDRSADVEAKNDANRTPLHIACVRGHDAIVALLLDGGADVEAKDDANRTPLHFACNRSHDPTVALLLDGGGDINAVDDANMTPLHFACDQGHDAIVSLLLDGGAVVEAKNDANMTPLHYACDRGHDAIVSLLLDRGAVVEAKNDENVTPLHWACIRGHDAIVALLLDRGADVEAKTDENMTPLHIACILGHDPTVALLLDGGGDLNAVDDANMTPLHYARDQDHESTVALLLAHGADDESDARHHRN